MRAEMLRPGLIVDGVRIKSRVAFVVNRQKFIRLTMADGTTRSLHPSAEVAVGGSRQEWFPAGPVQSNDLRDPKPNSRARVSDGRWAGEVGGFSVDQISRMKNYDLPGRQPYDRRDAPAGLRSK